VLKVQGGGATHEEGLGTILGWNLGGGGDLSSGERTGRGHGKGPPINYYHGDGRRGAIKRRGGESVSGLRCLYSVDQ